MSSEFLVVLMFGGLLLGLFMGFPVAFVMLGISLIVGVMGVGMGFFHMMLIRTFHVMTEYILVAVPLFIFMGVMLERSGAAEHLYSALHINLGGFNGGLAVATVVVCTVMAAATGIIGAPVVTMGLFALPEMLKRGYDKALSVGSVCAGGTLGILIPPSVMMVVYGPMAGISVGKLFMGAIFPGLVLSGLYVLYISLRCAFKPELGPALPPEERRLPLGRRVWMVTTSLLPTVFLILSVLGVIFFGVAAPTEAAAMGALASMFLAAGYGNLNWETLKAGAYRTLTVSSMIILTLVGAFVFSGTFYMIGGGDVVTNLLLGLPVGKWGMLAIMLFSYFVLGIFMEWVGILPILVPLFTPLAAKLGFDPLWFAILCCVAMQTSFLTPPMAPAIFYIRGVAPKEVKFGDIVRGVVPFIGLQLVGITLVVLIPSLATWLPGLMIRAR